MTPSPHNYSQQRAPRVKLSGSILVMLGLANGQHVRGTLHQLSINGGLLQLAEPLDASANTELIFHLGSTTVRAKAAMLFPIWATHECLQPFRFTEMADEVRHKLEADIQRMISGAMRLPDAGAATPHDSARPGDRSNLEPTQVSLFFDSSADALRFTIAISSVISAEGDTSVREDFMKLARAIANVSRVTTKGTLNGNGRHADHAASSLTAAS